MTLQHFSAPDPTTNSRGSFTWLEGLTKAMTHHSTPSPPGLPLLYPHKAMSLQMTSSRGSPYQ